jgi:hypothetical protein
MGYAHTAEREGNQLTKTGVCRSESTQKAEIDPQWHFDDSLHAGFLEIHLISGQGVCRKSSNER